MGVLGEAQSISHQAGLRKAFDELCRGEVRWLGCLGFPPHVDPQHDKRLELRPNGFRGIRQATPSQSFTVGGDQPLHSAKALSDSTYEVFKYPSSCKFLDMSLADEIAKVLSERPELIASALESKA